MHGPYETTVNASTDHHINLCLLILLPRVLKNNKNESLILHKLLLKSMCEERIPCRNISISLKTSAGGEFVWPVEKEILRYNCF